MGRWTRTVRLLLVVLALAADLTAQSLLSVTPTELTAGTLVTIQGNDLQGPAGKGKPKVWLVPEGGGKITKLKVLEASPGQLTVLLKKGQPGTYQLAVKPKGPGAATALWSDTVAVRPPQDVVLTSAVAGPDDEQELLGRLLGSKGKLWVGPFKAKVLAWEQGAVPSEDGLLDRVRFRVPKKAWSGQHAVLLQNVVGSAYATTALTVEGSQKPVKGKPRLEALLDGALFSAPVEAQVLGGQELRLTAVGAPAQLGEAAPVLTVRLRFDVAADSPEPLSQAFAEAYIAYERPVAGTTESETFASVDATASILPSKKGFTGTFQGNLEAQDGPGQLSLQAGTFLAKSTVLMEAVPLPSLGKFTVAPTHIELGEPVTYSIVVNDLDPWLTTVTLDLIDDPFTDLMEVPVGTSTYEHLFQNGVNQKAKLRVEHDGELVFTKSRTVFVSGPRVVITWPQDGSAVDGDLLLAAGVDGDGYDVSTVIGEVAGVEWPLTEDGVLGDYSVEIGAAGVPQGPYDLTVESTNVLGQAARDRVSIDWDEAPVLTVHEPTAYQVEPTGSLRVRLEASDSLGGPVALEVRFEGDLLLTGTDLIDQVVDLPGSGTLTITAEDEVGLTVEAELPVLVETSTVLTPVWSVPGLRLLDVDPGQERALGWDGQQFHEIDLVADETTLIPNVVPGWNAKSFAPIVSQLGKARITPRGAWYIAYGQDVIDELWMSWSDGELAELVPGSTASSFTAIVRGDWGLVRVDGQALRQRFSTGEQEWLGQTAGGDLTDLGSVRHVASSGDDRVVEVSADGTEEVLYADGSSSLSSVRGDGDLITVRRSYPGSTGWHLVQDGALLPVVDESVGPYSWDLACRGSWIAYVDPSQSHEVFLRAEDGTVTQVSPNFDSENMRVQALAPDGSLVFTDGSLRTHLWLPGLGLLQKPTDKSINDAHYRWTDAGWRVLIGDTAYAVTP